MNLQKTTEKRTVEKANIILYGQNSNTVINYKVLVVPTTNDRYTSEEAKKITSLSKAAMVNLTKIIEDLEVSTKTIFPTALCVCKGNQI